MKFVSHWEIISPDVNLYLFIFVTLKIHGNIAKSIAKVPFSFFFFSSDSLVSVDCHNGFNTERPEFSI